MPRWLIWGGLLTWPWTLNFSTHVINTSYVLPGAIVFFIGFFEGLPAMRRGLVPFAAAWAFMGAGLFWMIQIHMSWVLLPPYVLAAGIGVATGRGGEAEPGAGGPCCARRRASGLARSSPAACSLPTIARDGLDAGHLFGALTVQPQSPFGLVTTAARVLSFASFETLRFLGLTRAERLLVVLAPTLARAVRAGRPGCRHRAAVVDGDHGVPARVVRRRTRLAPACAC